MNSDESHHNRFFKTLDLVPETNRRVRIADILAGEGEEDQFDDRGTSCVVAPRRRFRSAASLQCASPRRIIARCLAALRPARERRALFGSQESEEGVDAVREFAGVSAHESRTANLPSSVDSPVSAAESDDSGRCRTDASFNLGVACGLLYLIGASKNEMNKMVEVRMQMEMLFQNFREELQNKNLPFKTAESDGTSLARLTSYDPQTSVQMNSPWTATSYVVPESMTILECDGDSSSRCVVDENEMEQQPVAGMDELEAELEAELELLEINLDTGHSSKLPPQRTLKIVVDTCSSSSYSSMSSLSQSPRSGVVIIDDDAQEINSEAQREVSPIELERKLHELLESRQQERIQELEEALEYTKSKLREKELEVSWWKDTARIISHHVPQSPQIVSQQNPKALRLLS